MYFLKPSRANKEGSYDEKVRKRANWSSKYYDPCDWQRSSHCFNKINS